MAPGGQAFIEFADQMQVCIKGIDMSKSVIAGKGGRRMMIGAFVIDRQQQQQQQQPSVCVSCACGRARERSGITVYVPYTRGGGGDARYFIPRSLPSMNGLMHVREAFED